jgi:AcrR family transcriptional regulator
MTGFKRAVTEEQKIERRQKILDSAKHLFEQADFQAIAITQIAQRAGIAKGSVFLYFKTKEELFLVLTLQELEAWNDDFDRRLERMQPGKSVKSGELSRLIDSTLLKNTLLVRLLAMVNIILEQNVGYDEAHRFKSALLKRAGKTGFLLEKTIGFFKKGDGIKFYLYLYILIVGLNQTSNPAPVIRKVLQHPDFHAFKIEFRPYFLDMLKHLLNGMEHSTGR